MGACLIAQSDPYGNCRMRSLGSVQSDRNRAIVDFGSALPLHLAGRFWRIGRKDFG